MKTGNFSSEFSEDGWESCNYQCSQARSFSPTRFLSLRWRDAEEQGNLWRLILTLFYYSPFLASKLSGISVGLHSLSWWKDSCAAEPIYSPAPWSTGVHNPCLRLHSNIRAIKNKSKPAWYKPFIKLVSAGTLSLFLNQKVLFWSAAAIPDQPVLMTPGSPSRRPFTVTVSSTTLFVCGSSQPARLSTSNTIRSRCRNAHLYEHK